MLTWGFIAFTAVILSAAVSWRLIMHLDSKEEGRRAHAAKLHDFEVRRWQAAMEEKALFQAPGLSAKPLGKRLAPVLPIKPSTKMRTIPPEIERQVKEVTSLLDMAEKMDPETRKRFLASHGIDTEDPPGCDNA